MVYCSKCGQKNEDNAQFCNKCGAKLKPTAKEYEKEWENQCERECESGTEGRGLWRIFWGIVIILIGLWILFELVLKNLAEQFPNQNIPVIDFQFWWIIGAVLGVIIIVSCIKIIFRR